MKEEINYSTGKPYCIITVAPEKEWIHVDWHGFTAKADDAKRALMKIEEVVKKTGISCLLNDNRNYSGPWPTEIFAWSQEVWIPSIYEYGLRYYAHIYSPQIFSQISANTFGKLPVPLKIKNFDSEASAIQWLRNPA